MNSVSQAINIKTGGEEPVLNPVQTPLEDLPMTPLYLNSEDNYFVLTNGSGQGAYRYKDDGSHFQSSISHIDETEELERKSEEHEDYNMMDASDV